MFIAQHENLENCAIVCKNLFIGTSQTTLLMKKKRRKRSLGKNFHTRNTEMVCFLPQVYEQTP